jgi:hypothetical protein
VRFQARNGSYGDEKTLRGIEFRSHCDQSHCVVTVLTELSQLCVVGLRKLRYMCTSQVRILVPPKCERSNVLTAKHRPSSPTGDRLPCFVAFLVFLG